MMTTKRKIGEKKQLFALIITTFIGASVIILLPIIINTLNDNQGYSTGQAGLLGSADVFGAAISALLLRRFIQSMDWRTLASIAVIVVIIVNLLSTVASDFYPLLIVRFLAGIFEGILLAIGNTGLAISKRPDRNIEIYLVSALLLGAGGIQLLSHIAALHGIAGVFTSLAVVAVLGLLTLAWLPSGPKQNLAATATTIDDERSSSRIALMGVGGVSFYFLALGILWGNLKLIGLDAAVNASSIDKALSLALIFGSSVDCPQ